MVRKALMRVGAVLAIACRFGSRAYAQDVSLPSGTVYVGQAYGNAWAGVVRSDGSRVWMPPGAPMVPNSLRMRDSHRELQCGWEMCWCR
jgi:hypothetical protein